MLEIHIANPSIYSFNYFDYHLIAHGTNIKKLELHLLASSYKNIDNIIENFISLEEECTIILVYAPEKKCVYCKIWRGINSNFECYYYNKIQKEFLLSDTFHNIVAKTPIEARILSENSIIDHMLFRTIPGKNTYSTLISRVGQGEKITIDFSTNNIRGDQFEKIELNPSNCNNHLLSLEESLNNNISSHFSENDCSVLLTGGIDSTLLTALAPHGCTTLSTEINTPEWSFERKYAEDAVKLTGSQHTFYSIDENNYLSELENTIDLLCMSPHHLQTVLMNTAFHTSPTVFLTGEMADCLFGKERSIQYECWRTWEYLHSRLPWRITSRIPKSVLRNLFSADIEYWHLTREKVSSTKSFAQNSSIWSQISTLEKIFSPEKIQQRIEARWQYVSDLGLKPLSDLQGIVPQQEASQWLTFFAEDTLSIWRQLAFAQGKSLYAPFAARSVINYLLSVPPSNRYSKNKRAKYLLKDLLNKKLPAYQVDKPKGHSGLPLERYFQNGPLSNAFEIYSAPDFISYSHFEKLKKQPNNLTWNILVMSILQKRIFAANISEIENSKIYQFTTK